MNKFYSITYLLCIFVVSLYFGTLIDPIHHNLSYLSYLNLHIHLIFYYFLCGIYLLIYTKKWMKQLSLTNKFNIIAYSLFLLFITSSLIPYQDNYSLFSKWHTRMALLAFILYLIFFLYLFYQSFLRNQTTSFHLNYLKLCIFISILLYFYSSHISYILEVFLMNCICLFLYFITTKKTLNP